MRAARRRRPAAGRAPAAGICRCAVTGARPGRRTTTARSRGRGGRRRLVAARRARPGTAWPRGRRSSTSASGTPAPVWESSVTRTAVRPSRCAPTARSTASPAATGPVGAGAADHRRCAARGAERHRRPERAGARGDHERRATLRQRRAGGPRRCRRAPAGGSPGCRRRRRPRSRSARRPAGAGRPCYGRRTRATGRAAQRARCAGSPARRRGRVARLVPPRPDRARSRAAGR